MTIGDKMAIYVILENDGIFNDSILAIKEVDNVSDQTSVFENQYSVQL